MADAPLYQWSLRLEDVWPDGKVSLVSGALINPADRESRLKQSPLVPGEKTKLTAEIHFTTWRFRPKRVNDKDPARATYEAVTNYTIRPPGRELRLVTKFRMASDEKNFYLAATRELFEAKKLVREKRWEKTIPRKNR